MFIMIKLTEYKDNTESSPTDPVSCGYHEQQTAEDAEVWCEWQQWNLDRDVLAGLTVSTDDHHQYDNHKDNEAQQDNNTPLWWIMHYL
jgi:hypothetical protein